MGGYFSKVNADKEFRNHQFQPPGRRPSPGVDESCPDPGAVRVGGATLIGARVTSICGGF
jgi:hypothetical protein